MLKKVIQIAKETRKKILDIYYSEKFEVDTKIDNSLVTKADRLASDFIGKELFESFGIPVITEESPVDYDQRKNWNEFWLVDPLDGTKEFIARNGEFSINISLIKKGVPVLGLIQIPVQDVSYYAEFGKGAFKETSQGISRIENLRKTK
ncbi:MAG: hypothetical protein KDD56_10320, partial [Bdellovibrionales bacterium]|nr:hypothetical protein [Bdellovibrionales bacterium]